MRIAVWHDPPPGGARRAVLELARRLAERHAVRLYTLGSAPQVDESDGLTVVTLPFQAHRHRRFAAYWNDWLTYRDRERLAQLERGIAADIDRAGFDVALLSVLRHGQAPDVLRALRTPAAYYCHEPPRRVAEPWCRPGANPLSLYERARQLWRWPAQTALDAMVTSRDRANVRAAQAVLTNSEYTRGLIQRAYARDAVVCRLGVDAEFFCPAPLPRGEAQHDARPRPRHDGGSLISVGALEAHKGFDFLVRAVARMPAERRPRLVIVGRGGHPRMPRYLRDLAKAYAVRLDLQIDVTDLELRDLYRQCDLFVFGAHFEPFGLVVLEAMACGLPVVVVDEGGVRESVRPGETGVLVPRDADAFAEAIDALLEDPECRASMARAARDCVLGYWSWERAAGQLEQCLLGMSGGA